MNSMPESEPKARNRTRPVSNLRLRKPKLPMNANSAKSPSNLAARTECACFICAIVGHDAAKNAKMQDPSITAAYGHGISLGAFRMALGVGVNEAGSISWRSRARRGSSTRRLGGLAGGLSACRPSGTGPGSDRTTKPSRGCDVQVQAELKRISAFLLNKVLGSKVIAKNSVVCGGHFKAQRESGHLGSRAANSRSQELTQTSRKPKTATRARFESHPPRDARPTPG